MQTSLIESIKATSAGREADAILRKCVHCGFCLAACPTYELLGDEQDSPRGRIYLIKQVLEGTRAGAATQLHLDRCLTCRACETACPSGVEYGRLLDIGRAMTDAQVNRSLRARIERAVIRKFLLSPRLFAALLGLGRWLRTVLPRRLREQVPVKQPAKVWPAPRHRRTMLVLDGCVQPALAPSINAAAASVLDRLGISLIRVRGAGCCGALSHHLTATDEALALARRNIDAWWPLIEAGAEAIVVTASGCGTMVADYGHMLREDRDYAAKAAKISAMSLDVSRVVANEQAQLQMLFRAAERPAGLATKLAFQSPCSLQHGQRVTQVVESLLSEAGFKLAAVPNAYRCCGSAGSYSLLQQSLSIRLRDKKLADLQADAPQAIVTANIGCLVHLQRGTRLPVRHWIELLAERIEETGNEQRA